MWIYYYASYGPGSQSYDCGFKHFHDSCDREDIKDHLYNTIDSNGYDIGLEFWEVKNPPAKYIEDKIKNTKDRIKRLKQNLNMLESQSCFIPEEKDGEDTILIKNLRGCIDSDLLKRLHKAGFMYSSDDICNWYYGKKCPLGPERSKILRIIRKADRYPSYK